MIRKASVGRGFRKGGSRSRKTLVFQRRPPPFHKSAVALFSYHPLILFFSLPSRTNGSGFFYSCLSQKVARTESCGMVLHVFENGYIRQKKSPPASHSRAPPHRHVAKRYDDDVEAAGNFLYDDVRALKLFEIIYSSQYSSKSFIVS